MGIFESLNQTSDKALDVGEQYFKKTQEYYKLKVFQQLVTTTGMFCKIVLIGSFLFLGLILTAVAGTLALGEFIGNIVFACLISASLLLLAGAILYTFRTKIDSVIVQKMAKQFFD
ncbi:hypothetical protein [Ulvibacterium marinum]|uniref:hypothetical protein n=1 Tax=Ulvibacterium marinum TaxID=2419782 RepID=UPI00249587B7|nr:hypothetical protein [Ulvibacterium marinum]